MRPRKTHASAWMSAGRTYCGQQIADDRCVPAWEATCKTCIRVAQSHGIDTDAAPRETLREMPVGTKLAEPERYWTWKQIVWMFRLFFGNVVLDAKKTSKVLEKIGR